MINNISAYLKQLHYQSAVEQAINCVVRLYMHMTLMMRKRDGFFERTFQNLVAKSSTVQTRRYAVNSLNCFQRVVALSVARVVPTRRLRHEQNLKRELQLNERL